MSLVSLLRRLTNTLRTAWLVVGVSLLLALALEGLYLTQAAFRSMLRGGRDGSRHPNAGETWWAEWVQKAGAVNGPSRYDPYRGWWATPYTSPQVHVDDAGRRVTIPAPAPGPVTHRVVFLGGSVMWGYTVPDSLTIPSLVARRLRESGQTGVEVLNLAQPSYNATQGLITLLLELRSGLVPDAVVSLDGNNEVLVELTEGHPGAAFGERDLARRSAVGWRGLWSNIAGLARYSALLNRLARLEGPPRVGQGGGGSPVPCDTTTVYYVNVVAAAQALGRRFDFTSIYLWQPHWATTQKRLTPWEQGIRAQPGFPELMRRCTAAVESVMAAREDLDFVSFTKVFDQDTMTVFLDEFGHMTPAGNQRLAEAIAVRLLTGPTRLRD
jgi:hypothetical protein